VEVKKYKNISDIIYSDGFVAELLSVDLIPRSVVIAFLGNKMHYYFGGSHRSTLISVSGAARVQPFSYFLSFY